MKYVYNYQVEVQDGADWVTDRSYQPRYRWQSVVHKILGLFRWGREQRLMGDAEALALIAKAEAVVRARYMLLHSRPASIRITRSEREGARLVKFVVWLNGEWCE
jgi:hypothetical protein